MQSSAQSDFSPPPISRELLATTVIYFIQRFGTAILATNTRRLLSLAPDSVVPNRSQALFAMREILKFTNEWLARSHRTIDTAQSFLLAWIRSWISFLFIGIGMNLRAKFDVCSFPVFRLIIQNSKPKGDSANERNDGVRKGLTQYIKSKLGEESPHLQKFVLIHIPSPLTSVMPRLSLPGAEKPELWCPICDMFLLFRYGCF